MEMDPTGRPVTDTGTAGVVGRPILFFPAAILVGLALDRLLPLPFAIPKADGVPWIVGGCLIVIGLVSFHGGLVPGRNDLTTLRL
jgi:hypothetical protein